MGELATEGSGDIHIRGVMNPVPPAPYTKPPLKLSTEFDEPAAQPTSYQHPAHITTPTTGESANAPGTSTQSQNSDVRMLSIDSMFMSIPAGVGAIVGGNF